MPLPDVPDWIQALSQGEADEILDDVIAESLNLFDESKHQRVPAGSPDGGQFTSGDSGRYEPTREEVEALGVPSFETWSEKVAASKRVRDKVVSATTLKSGHELQDLSGWSQGQSEQVAGMIAPTSNWTMSSKHVDAALDGIAASMRELDNADPSMAALLRDRVRVAFANNDEMPVMGLISLRDGGQSTALLVINTSRLPDTVLDMAIASEHTVGARVAKQAAEKWSRGEAIRQLYRSMMDHEMGHAVDYASGWTANAGLAQAAWEHAVEQKHSSGSLEDADWRSKWWNDHVSSYAYEGGPREAFAESYSAWRMGIADPVIKAAMPAILKRAQEKAVHASDTTRVLPPDVLAWMQRRPADVIEIEDRGKVKSAPMTSLAERFVAESLWMLSGEFDESKHPRDEAGRFTESGYADDGPPDPKRLVERFLRRATGKDRVEHEDYQPVHVTSDPNRTKFLLPDGTRLTGNGEHSDIVFESLGRKTGDANVRFSDVLDAGIIRYSAGGGIQISQPLTEKQAATIADDWNYHYGSLPLIVDAAQRDASGKFQWSTYYKEMPRPVSADALRRASLVTKDFAATELSHRYRLGWCVTCGTPRIDCSDFDESKHPRDDRGRWTDGDDGQTGLPFDDQPPAGSMTADQMRALPMPASVRDAEDRIRHQPNEHGYLFKGGKTTYIGSDLNDGVVLPSEGIVVGSPESPYYDAVFTHNHPSGTGLSFPDLWVATHHQMAEIRATTKSGTTYVAKRGPDGWPHPDYIKSLHTLHNSQVRGEFTRKIGTGELSVSEANARHHQEVWQRVVISMRRDKSKGSIIFETQS